MKGEDVTEPSIYAVIACLQALITPILEWEKAGMTINPCAEIHDIYDDN